MLRTSGTLHQKPTGRYSPNAIHLVQRQTAERAEPASQIVKLSVDLFFALRIRFFHSVTIAAGGPLPRSRQFPVRGLKAVMHRQDVVLGDVQ